MRLFLLLLAILLPACVQAGLQAQGTRLIYPAGSDGQSLLIANSNDWPVLVQTWVDDGTGDPLQASAPFVVLPVVFRLEPGATQNLRILYSGESLPAERESLFWLNLYEVPPTVSAAERDDGAQLDLALNTQMKLFYRPQGLGAPDNLSEQLGFEVQGHSLLVRNPTPWHASFSELAAESAEGLLNAEEAQDLLLLPFSERRFRLQAGQPGAFVQFSLIDDLGEIKLYRRELSR